MINIHTSHIVDPGDMLIKEFLAHNVLPSERELYTMPKGTEVEDARVDSMLWTAYAAQQEIAITTYLCPVPALERLQRQQSLPAIVGPKHAAICTSYGSTKNYYHWLIQSMTSIVWILYADRARCPILIPSRLGKYQSELFEILQLDICNPNHFFSCPHESIVEIEDLFIPNQLLYHGSVSHPSPIALGILKAQVLSSPIIKNKLSQREPRPRRIYISRSKSRRGIYRENDLEVILIKIGFEVVYSEDLSVADQIAMFANAEVVVAPHGAGLSNIVFAPSHAKIIEINQLEYINNCFSRPWRSINPTSAYHHVIYPSQRECPKRSDTNDHLLQIHLNFDEFAELLNEII
jgi:capsular polysaccharide biosynthesis protein